VDAPVIPGRTQRWTGPFGYPEVRRRTWIQEFYQDGSARLRMSFDNDRWQNIETEYTIFRRPHGENSERTDALAVRCPRTRPHLKCCAALCHCIPLRVGPEEQAPVLGLGSSAALLQCRGAVRTQPRSSPATLHRNIESACVLGTILPAPRTVDTTWSASTAYQRHCLVRLCESVSFCGGTNILSTVPHVARVTYSTGVTSSMTNAQQTCRSIV
jgi:hypothetical protein